MILNAQVANRLEAVIIEAGFLEPLYTTSNQWHYGLEQVRIVGQLILARFSGDAVGDPDELLPEFRENAYLGARGLVPEDIPVSQASEYVDALSRFEDVVSRRV